MAGVGENELKTMAGWPAGIDNRSKEQSLTRDETGKVIIALRDAENVDLAKDGKVSRRDGYTRIYGGTRLHSLWRDGEFPYALFAEGDALMALRADRSVFAIASGLTPGKPVSYALAGARVFWSNGVEKGIVDSAGEAWPWGCPNPGGTPILQPYANGGLVAGTYQVALTFALGTGEESGASLAATLDVAAGGGILLTSIPQPQDPAVAKVRVYVSPANGDVLYHALDVAPGVTSAVLGVGRRGKPLETQFLEPVPAGHIVRWLNSRVYVADGATLRWTEALRYGLTHPGNNRVGLPARIDMLETLGAGTEAAGAFVATGKRTLWLPLGAGGATAQRIAYPYGAIPGTSTVVPAKLFGITETDRVAYWMARDGVAVLGLPGGVTMPLRDGQVTGPIGEAGASLLRDRNGTRQIITTLRGAQGFALGDSLAVTVRRHDP